MGDTNDVGERESLLKNDSDSVTSGSKQNPSRSITRQRVILAIVMIIQFWDYIPETIIYPFFPQVAEKKGLTGIEIGIVLASFDLARFAACPTFGSLVSRFNIIYGMAKCIIW